MNATFWAGIIHTLLLGTNLSDNDLQIAKHEVDSEQPEEKLKQAKQLLKEYFW